MKETTSLNRTFIMKSHNHYIGYGVVFTFFAHDDCKEKSIVTPVSLYITHGVHRTAIQICKACYRILIGQRVEQ